MKPEIRKVLSVIERIRMEGGEPVASGESVKVAVGAVCRNPYAGKFVRGLTPLKDAACLMSHLDTLEFVIPDAPRPDEVVIVVAYGVGPRPQARIIGLPKDQIQGEDRYAYTGGLVYTKRAPDGSATSA